MKSMLTTLAIASLMASCTTMPVPLANGKGGAEKFRQFGGKFTITYNADGSVAMTGDNEISFQHGAQTLPSISLKV